ncbi:MAG: ATP-binding protein [Defluviitaleaceae bacterium]|nr:ATP-binding protein [Defluviitaleaceae bacterium]
MNAKLILVSGHGATGKSTFSRRLSKQFGIPCFCKDTIKEAMADGFDVGNDTFSAKTVTYPPYENSANLQGCCEADMALFYRKKYEEVFKKGSAATFKVVLHLAECCLQVGKTCILESNFRKTESEEIQALLEKYNADCLTYNFTGDLDILHERYKNRQDAGERHWIHLDVNVNDKNSFVNWHMHYKTGEIEVGQVIRADATDFAKIDYDKLLSTAEDFL